MSRYLVYRRPIDFSARIYTSFIAATKSLKKNLTPTSREGHHVLNRHELNVPIIESRNHWEPRNDQPCARPTATPI
jgi:hypothetical protein